LRSTAAAPVSESAQVLPLAHKLDAALAGEGGEQGLGLGRVEFAEEAVAVEGHRALGRLVEAEGELEAPGQFVDDGVVVVAADLLTWAVTGCPGPAGRVRSTEMPSSTPL
jgi:hypothetical protein